MPLFLIHAALMAAGFLFVLSALIVAMTQRRERWWLKVHRAIGLTGSSLMLLGAITAIAAVASTTGRASSPDAAHLAGRSDGCSGDRHPDSRPASVQYPPKGNSHPLGSPPLRPATEPHDPFHHFARFACRGNYLDGQSFGQGVNDPCFCPLHLRNCGSLAGTGST